jgi:hypothetical protein
MKYTPRNKQKISIKMPPEPVYMPSPTTMTATNSAKKMQARYDWGQFEKKQKR